MHACCVVCALRAYNISISSGEDFKLLIDKQPKPHPAVEHIIFVRVVSVHLRRSSIHGYLSLKTVVSFLYPPPPHHIFSREA